MKIFSTDWVDEIPNNEYGGKASNLGALSRGGMKVPPGFALAPDENPSMEDVQFLIDSVCDGFPVAVRSSAIGEDGTGFSVAGQYDTILNLGTIEGVMKAIGSVRESAHNERVESYQTEFALEATGVGVVIQQMVRAISSGGMFTAEPVESDPDYIAIESVTGFGDKLGSGMASPDFHLVEKTTEAVVESTCINNPVLGRTELKILTEAGKSIEKMYGCPQDIEWAFGYTVGSNQALFILQSRPITTV